MGFLSYVPILGPLIDKITDKIAPDKGKVLEGQNRINEAEVTGGPASILRLWRSFLGWVLSLTFAWEVIVRPIIVTYRPETLLPPSVLSEISRLLIGMLGLGI